MARRRSGTPVRTLRAGPYVGVRDTKDATSAAPALATGMTNVYSRDPRRNSALVGRPGVTMTHGGTQLGPTTARRVQAAGEFQRLGGARYTFCVVGGRFYTYNWTTNIWSQVTLTGGAALSSTAEIVCWVVCANQLVLSDGVNTPAAWDGSTWTVLTNCPVLLYQPWVHLGRLWGIKASDGGATIVWSEPNQLNTGYEATIGLITYRNAWTLGQTSQDGIVAGRGLNDRLVLWRRNSTTAIYGQVDEDFSTTGTRDTIAETVGCGAPYAVQVVDGAVYWMAADGRLCVLQPGAQVNPIGLEIPEATSALTITALNQVRVTYDAYAQLVLFAVPVEGATTPTVVWPVHTANDQPQGTWVGWSLTALGTVRDPGNLEVRLHGGLDGRIYRHGHPTQNLWNDELHSGTVAIYHTVRSEPMGWQETTDQFWDRVDVTFRAATRLTNLTVQAIGPYGYGLAASTDAQPVGGQWDLAKWDIAVFAGEGIDQHATFGFETHGRWQQFEVRHQQLGETFGFLSLQAWVRPEAAYPNIA